MGAALLVIPLVGLMIPIMMLLLAIVFDLGVLAWALYRISYDHLRPMLVRVEERVIILARVHRPIIAVR
jgi:hypothetical protein